MPTAKLSSRIFRRCNSDATPGSVACDAFPTRRRDTRGRQRRGAVLMLMVILLPVVLLMCAFAINMAYMELSKTEMYVAADAAARAGVREYATTQNAAAAIARAKSIAVKNEIASAGLQLSNSDIQFGHANRVSANGRYNFVAGGGSINSVQVTANRSSSSLGGEIPLLLPNLLGVSSFERTQSSIATQIEVDVALVIDRSGSMAYSVLEVAAYPPQPSSAPPGWNFCDPAPPVCRWRNVLDAVDVFMTEVANSPASEQVSLTTYNDNAITNQDLTTSYASIATALAPITNSFCAGGTNISAGINEAAAALQLSPSARPGAAKVILLLTDGIQNLGGSPTSAARNASADGVQIYTVTFSDEADQSSMQTVADEGGGLHFHANSPSDLSAAFQEIAKRLPTLLTQ